MAYGWEVSDASGNTIMSTALPCGTVLGVINVDTGNWDGNLTDSDLANGDSWWWTYCGDSDPYHSPDVWFSGTNDTTINWTDNSGELVPFQIFYGIH